MKSARILTALLMGSVLFATSAFAADKTKVQIREAVTVNGSALPAGDYTVTWEGTGPGVELKFLKGKNTVATVPAHMVKLAGVTANSQIVTQHDAANTLLTEIQPGGKNYSLAIGGEGVQTSAQNQ